jgi:hypothetical protein
MRSARKINVEVREVVGRIDTLAVFQRNLVDSLLPDILQCVEVAVLQTLKTA